MLSNTITARAPAASALRALSMNVQSPRSIIAILPLTATAFLRSIIRRILFLLHVI